MDDRSFSDLLADGCAALNDRRQRAQAEQQQHEREVAAAKNLQLSMLKLAVCDALPECLWQYVQYPVDTEPRGWDEVLVIVDAPHCSCFYLRLVGSFGQGIYADYHLTPYADKFIIPQYKLAYDRDGEPVVYTVAHDAQVDDIAVALALAAESYQYRRELEIEYDARMTEWQIQQDQRHACMAEQEHAEQELQASLPYRLMGVVQEIVRETMQGRDE